MTYITVESFAKETQIAIDQLIQQFADLGIHKNTVDIITQQEKDILLIHLKNMNNIIPKKLTLQRKTHSILNIPSIGGKNKLVKIEIRRKHIYFKHDLQVHKQTQLNNQDIHEMQKLHLNKLNEDLKKDQYNVEDKSKIVDIEKKKNVAFKQKNRSATVNNTFINQKNIDVWPNSNKKQLLTTNLKRKVANEICNKLENRNHQVIEESHQLIEKNLDIFNNRIDFAKENKSNYNTTNSAYTAKDNNEHKIKDDNRIRNRINKNTKYKKNNRLSEFKNDREEIRVISKNDNKNKRKQNILTQSFNKPIQAISRNIIIGETITVAELANRMAVKGSQVIKTMIKMGAMVTLNQIIDQETAQIVAEDMGHKVILRCENDIEDLVNDNRNIKNNNIAEPRAPVVTIMGHVNHGKTSLLDYIRSTKIAANEAGGITQHIGAYHVNTNNGIITFLDTPGHAAFTAMRARGALATDIIVLVVAADDGVMPQTIEAIQHAKVAKVPIIVAINKIDKTESNYVHIKHELSKYDITSDEWGGENQFIYISAKSGKGIDNLLDAILLQAEILELKAIRNGIASGIVIESFLDKNRGPIATVLVREGSLNKGDIILCGFEYGRVRAMRNEIGQNISLAGPSMPVEILGLSGTPAAGDKMTVVHDEKKAREVAFYRQGKFRDIKLSRQKKSKLENIFANVTENKILELNIVLKSDVQGYIEAIINALEILSNDEIKVQIIASSVGYITETDAILAATSNAIIIGFNVKANNAARRIIELERLDLRYYSVIYDLINEVKQIVNNMLLPKYKNKIIGLVEVRNIFCSPKFGSIAGCIVTEGIIKRHSKIRILRNNIVIHEGELESLRRFKDDVNEVRHGIECGIKVKNYNDIMSGDKIEVFEINKIQHIN